MVSAAIRAARTPDSAALTRAVWPAVAVASGLAIGVASTFDLITAVLLAVALAVAPLVVLFPPLLTPLLIVTVFAQVISVSGVTISRIIAPLALFVVLVALHRGGYVLRAGSPLGWVCAYAFWALASGLWTVHLGDTISALSSLAIALTYMLAFAILVRSRRELDRVLYTLAVVAFVVGVIGIFTSKGRAEGASGNPNFFAMVEIFALPLVLALAAEVRRRAVRIALYVVVFVIILSVFASLSRGGFLTLVTFRAARTKRLCWRSSRPARSAPTEWNRAHSLLVCNRSLPRIKRVRVGRMSGAAHGPRSRSGPPSVSDTEALSPRPTS